MKIRNNYLTFFILFGISAAFYSCNGQEKSRQSTEIKQSPNSPNLSELDPKAAVIFHDRKNNFWFVSEDKGVYRYDGEHVFLFTSADGLISYRILSVQEDNSGNLYFDTPKGICKYDGQRFRTLTVVANEASENEWKSEPGDLWFRMGWDSGGPYRFDGKNLYQLLLPKNKMEDEFYAKYPNVSFNPYGIYSIYKDRKGNLWFGTSSLGVYLFDGKELSWMYENHLTETPQGGAFGFRSVIEDREGNYWICNANYRYTLLPNHTAGDGLKPMNYTRQIGIDTDEAKGLYFLSMVPDNNGDILMRTYESGVWRNTGKELIPFFIQHDGKSISPTSIYKDNEGALWFGTENDGIYKSNGTDIEKFR